MCGITVAVALRGTSFAEKEDISGHLKESLARIAHRGPDAQGVWISEDGRLGELPMVWNSLFSSTY